MPLTPLNWPSFLKGLYDRCVELYRGGNHDMATYFSGGEVEELNSIGLRPINVYDHAEDMVKYGEPDWETFLLVASARRDFFIHVLSGRPAEREIPESELPPKTEAFEGVVWLPRILVKARAFLDGSLCQHIMYGCGGDRRFFRDNSIHAADFLRIVWASQGDDHKVLALMKEFSRH